VRPSVVINQISLAANWPGEEGQEEGDHTI